MTLEDYSHDLIVTIIRKGCCERVLRASQKAGAEGGTIIFGRGAGIHEQKKLLGIPIEPEKEVILTLISKEKTDTVLEAIIEAGNLNKPGTGISFVLDVKKVAGIVHLLKQTDEKSNKSDDEC